jgi:hypothetical protein
MYLTIFYNVTAITPEQTPMDIFNTVVTPSQPSQILLSNSGDFLGLMNPPQAQSSPLEQNGNQKL